MFLYTFYKTDARNKLTTSPGKKVREWGKIGLSELILRIVSVCLSVYLSVCDILVITVSRT